MFATDGPSWRNPRVLGILVLVFVSGAAAGAAAMQYRLHDMMHRPGGGTFWVRDRHLSYDNLTKELHLSTRQRSQLKTILDDFARYHQDLQAQMDDWQATGKNQILRILDPEQRARFERLTRE